MSSIVKMHQPDSSGTGLSNSLPSRVMKLRIGTFIRALDKLNFTATAPDPSIRCNGS